MKLCFPPSRACRLVQFSPRSLRSNRLRSERSVWTSPRSLGGSRSCEIAGFGTQATSSLGHSWHVATHLKFRSLQLIQSQSSRHDDQNQDKRAQLNHSPAGVYRPPSFVGLDLGCKFQRRRMPESGPVRDAVVEEQDAALGVLRHETPTQKCIHDHLAWVGLVVGTR